MNRDKCYYSNHFNLAVKFEIKIIAFTVTTTRKVCMDTHTHTLVDYLSIINILNNNTDFSKDCIFDVFKVCLYVSDVTMVTQ